MFYKVFLYPQTLFYPPHLLKVDPFVEKYFILNLLETEARLKSLFQDKFPKIHLLTIKKELDIPSLSKMYLEFKNFGLSLRTPENLKIYKLHQELFEDTYPILNIREKPLDSTERAFLLLSLAEDIDFTLLEVSLSLNDFTKKWEQIFQEKILFKDLYFPEEDTLNISFLEENKKEKLWEIQKRIESLKILLPHLDYPEDKPDSLLISEEEIFDDWRDELEIREEKILNEDILIFELKKPLNERLALPQNFFYPKFTRIIIVR